MDANNPQRSTTLRNNTEVTANVIRNLFLQRKAENPDLTLKKVIELVTVQAAEKTPAGNWVYLASNMQKALHRQTIVGYLHGLIGPPYDKRRIGEDLLPERHRKSNRQPQADGLATVLELLAHIDAQLVEVRAALRSGTLTVQA